jgi:hypothetical protein
MEAVFEIRTRKARAALLVFFLTGAVFLGGNAAGAGSFDATLGPYFVIKGTVLERRILHVARHSVRRALGDDVPGLERISWPTVPSGVFITLMEGHRVRACAGTFAPAESSLSEALIALGRQVVSVDTRREPPALEELGDLKLVVSFVGRPEACTDPFDIDFRREGLKTLVEGQQRLLLPGESRTLSYGIQNVLGVRHPERAVFERFSVVTMDERSWEE